MSHLAQLVIEENFPRTPNLPKLYFRKISSSIGSIRSLYDVICNFLNKLDLRSIQHTFLEKGSKDRRCIFKTSPRICSKRVRT